MCVCVLGGMCILCVCVFHQRRNSSLWRHSFKLGNEQKEEIFYFIFANHWNYLKDIVSMRLMMASDLYPRLSLF